MDNYFDLGDYRRSITSADTTAQTWFNRGLVWCYAFNQEEAVRCFEKVLELDPECAMGHWGIAYAAGPFYNKPWEWYGEQERIRAIAYCHEHASRAVALKPNASALEQSLIDALHRKHPADQANSNAQLDNWMRDYADAMRAAYAAFPDDLDVLCLCTEAVMNLTPWKLWNLQQGVPAEDAATSPQKNRTKTIT